MYSFFVMFTWKWVDMIFVPSGMLVAYSAPSEKIGKKMCAFFCKKKKNPTTN